MLPAETRLAGLARRFGVSPRALAALIALALTSMLLYAGTLFYPPIWDDHSYVFGQALLMDCGNLLRVLSPRNFVGVLVEANSSRPVWLASVLLDTCAGDRAVAVYRITSLSWHAMGAVLVVALTWSLVPSLEAAAAAGILFAVHPAHAETVNIITYRSDLLCLAFMLATVLLYRHRRPASALLCAALALLSKEMAVVLPLQILLADAFFPNPSPAGRRRFLAALSVLVLAYLVFHAPRSGYVLGGRPDAFTALERRANLPFTQPLTEPAPPLYGIREKPEPPAWNRIYDEPETRALTMSRVLGSYLRLLAWPNELQGDYEPKIVDSPLDPGAIAAWAAWAALLAAAWFLRRRIPLFGFGIGWTAAALIPVSGLVPILNLQAERYLYTASAGWCMAIAGLLAALAGRGRRGLALILLTVLAAAGGWRLVRRNRDFRSDRAFFQATLAVDPSVGRAHLSLAYQCANEGDAPCAEREFREALRLWPDNLTAHVDFADVLHRQGLYGEESSQLEAARRLAPASAKVLLRIGLLQWRQGRREEAVRQLRAATIAAPGYWIANTYLGILLLEMGRDREAAECLRGVRWESNWPLYHFYVAERRLGRARDFARELAALKRRDPALASMALSPHPELYPPDWLKRGPARGGVSPRS